MRKVASAFAAVLVAVVVLPVTGAAQPRTEVRGSGSDIREFDPKVHRELVANRADRSEAQALAPDAAPPVVGEERTWLAIDDAEGTLFPKVYTLRGIGDHIEVWVASDSDEISSDTDFPAGDCRNDGVRNVITDEQVQYLIDTFDNNIYPTESELYSVAPPQDGTNAPLTGILGLPKNYYKGPGDRVVTLIDNVRDENFYDTNNSQGLTYVAGFFTSTYNFYFDRLTMTIDAFDWLHRTGANPPNEPSSDLCQNKVARPFLYEGVFAHEYQHLLQSYVPGGEVTWVDEGLADHAITMTGLGDPSLPVTDIGFDNHVQCFLGYNMVESPANPIPRPGGPENSLTRWGDQTDYEQEILCDYGAAYTFMEYLSGQFGADFMTALHLDPEVGLDSLAGLLDGEADDLTVGTIITRWALMVAVDKVLDDGWTLVGGDAATLNTPTLNADVNWDNDQAYSAPGAPPNGSDYVRLRDATDTYLSVAQVTSVEFNGASELPPLPLRWKVDRRPPKHGDGPALYSGKGDNLDRALARTVRVGNDGKLEFDAAWDTEEGYDYAYVQVSDDGGRSWRTVRCTDSIDAPLGPGFEGNSGGFVHETCNLRKYAGERVILSFRYVTDGGVIFDGFWVDNVEVGGDILSTGRSLRGWDSPTEINPTDVQAFVVQIVAFDQTGHVVHVTEVPLDANFDGSLSETALTDALGTSGSTISAIVTYLDRTEQVQQQAPYTLTVNGVAQPGGGA